MKKASIHYDLDLSLEVIAKLSDEELQPQEGEQTEVFETTSFCVNPPFSYIR